MLVARPERVRGEGLEGIDYRHIVHSLIRKPGAFRRYVYREAMFPSMVFRRAYDGLCERSQKWADLEYIRILHLAATTMQCEVGRPIGDCARAQSARLGLSRERSEPCDFAFGELHDDVGGFDRPAAMRAFAQGERVERELLAQHFPRGVLRILYR